MPTAGQLYCEAGSVGTRMTQEKVDPLKEVRAKKLFP